MAAKPNSKPDTPAKKVTAEVVRNVPIAYTKKNALEQEVINWEAFPVEVKTKVKAMSKQLEAAMQEFGATVYKIGKIFFDIRKELQDRGKSWTVFAGSIPGFGQATVFRYIASFEASSRNIPKPLLDTILSRGIDMIGSNAVDKPYARYTDAVKKLERKTVKFTDKASGKTVTVPKLDDIKTPADAEVFVSAVIAEKAQEAHGKKSRPTPEEMQRACYRFFRSCWNRLEESDRKITFVLRTCEYIMVAAGIDSDTTVHPRDIPDDWKPKTKPGRPAGKKKAKKVAATAKASKKSKGADAGATLPPVASGPASPAPTLQ